MLGNFEDDTKRGIIDSMTSHHAVLLSVESPLTFEPEFDAHVVYREPQCGIGMVRSLISSAYRRPQAQDKQQLIMVATEFITEEAQQALLKIIEEPPVSTKFLFVLPQGYTLLSTLESRFERQLKDGEDVCDDTLFQSFAQLSYADRMAAIEESTKKKDLVWQKAIKQGLLAYIRTERGRLSYDTVKELEYVARLLLSRGASNKFLLEHLALTLSA